MSKTQFAQQDIVEGMLTHLPSSICSYLRICQHRATSVGAKCHIHSSIHGASQPRVISCDYTTPRLNMSSSNYCTLPHVLNDFDPLPSPQHTFEGSGRRQEQVSMWRHSTPPIDHRTPIPLAQRHKVLTSQNTSLAHQYHPSRSGMLGFDAISDESDNSPHVFIQDLLQKFPPTGGPYRSHANGRERLRMSPNLHETHSGNSELFC